MPNCANGFGTCLCFASGCGYVGEDNVVHGCDSMCCRGRCPSQVSQGPDLDSKKYVWILGAFLVLLAVLSTLSLT